MGSSAVVFRWLTCGIRHGAVNCRGCGRAAGLPCPKADEARAGVTSLPAATPRAGRLHFHSAGGTGRDRLICYVLAELFWLGRPPSPSASLTARIALSNSGFVRIDRVRERLELSPGLWLAAAMKYSQRRQQHQGAMHATATRKGSEDRARSEMFLSTRRKRVGWLIRFQGI
jgi:hypothetical protein